MTKVEHTKTQTIYFPISNHPKDRDGGIWNDKLVTDAELVLVVCEEVKYAILHNIINRNGKFFKPILISRTEKIEVGDWITDGKRIAQVNVLTIDDPNRDKHSKILALPEHFSQQQLQDIVDGKLKEGKCLVECEKKYSPGGAVDCGDPDDDGGAYKYNQIKLNPHITIYNVEEKMYTKEEVQKIVRKAFDAARLKNKAIDKVGYGSGHGSITGQKRKYTHICDKWFEQNVK